MKRDLDNLRFIYEYQLEKFEKGGHAPEKVKAYRRTVELLHEAESVDDWKKKMEAENQFFKLGRSVAADQYYALAEAKEGTFEKTLSDVYYRAAQMIASAKNEEESYRLSEEASRLIEKKEDEEQKKRSAFNYVFKYLLRFYASGIIISELVSVIKKHVKDLGGRDNFRAMARDEAYNAFLPLNSEQIEKVLKKLPQLLDFEEEDITEEQWQWIHEYEAKCNKERGRLYDLWYRYMHMGRYKAEYIAEAPFEEEGMYSIDLLIKKEEDELGNDVWGEPIKNDKDAEQFMQNKKEYKNLRNLFILHRYTKEEGE